MLIQQRESSTKINVCLVGAGADMPIDIPMVRRSLYTIAEQHYGLPRFYNGYPENGGTPQAQPVPTMLAQAVEVVPRNWNGWLTLDADSWSLLDFGNDVAFKAQCISEARFKLPIDATQAQIEGLAKRELYDCGVGLFNRSISWLKAARPQAKCGVLGWFADTHTSMEWQPLKRAMGGSFLPVYPREYNQGGYGNVVGYRWRMCKGTYLPSLAVLRLRYTDEKTGGGTDWWSDTTMREVADQLRGEPEIGIWDDPPTPEIAAQYPAQIARLIAALGW